jgi:hypothetical protein
MVRSVRAFVIALWTQDRRYYLSLCPSGFVLPVSSKRAAAAKAAEIETTRAFAAVARK